MKNRTYTILGLWLLATIALFLSACSKTKSENIKTDGIFAEMNLIGNNGKYVTCSTTLKVGGTTGTVIDLSVKETLTCDGYPMTRSEDFLGLIRYQVQLPYVAGKVYSIVFQRPDEKAYVASATMPPFIKQVYPTSGTLVTKGSNITVSWKPSPATEDSLTASLNYTDSKEAGSLYAYDDYPENGLLGFSSSHLYTSEVDKGVKEGSIQFTRYHYGQMPEELKGFIKASQETSIVIKFID